MRSRSAYSFFALALLVPACVSASNQGDLISERAVVDYAEVFSPEMELTIAEVSRDVPGASGIAEFWMDPPTGRFLANILSDHGGVHRVSGLIQVHMRLPVPTRRLMPGDVVSADDLVVARLPVGRIGSFVVKDASALVGMEVRRVLQEGRPVMEQSVARPFAVERGTRVTIAFRQGALRLVAPGRALGDAHSGEPIRVVNLSSNKTITATAKGNGLVEVMN